MQFIKLRISGNDLPFEKIESQLKMPVKFKCRKGETNGDVTYSDDCIIYEKEADSSVPVDDFVGSFADEFYAERDFLSALSSSCDMTLWLSLYPENEQAQIGLSNHNLQKIADCGLHLHTTVMFLEKFYNGEYGSRTVN